MAQDILPNKSFFENVLKVICAENNNNKKQWPILIDFEAKPVVATGDSYTSNIKRVFIKYKNPGETKCQMVPVILKTQVRGSVVEDWTIELDFFKNEIEMFSDIFPRLQKILNGHASSISGKCYVATDKPDFTLVLEDLQPIGYQMQDRQIGFDTEHTKGVLNTLARLHAASVVLARKYNKVETYTKGLFSDSKVSMKWMDDGLKSLSKTCKSIKGCEQYGRKLDALSTAEAVKRVMKSAQRSIGFNVLNHGDMWANNMLFLHDQHGKLQDTKLIDFQLVKFTSPALDLHYFYATSVMNHVRDKFGHILDFYYSQLMSNLVELGYLLLENVPSRMELQTDFEERAFYGVISLATVAPLVKSPPHKDANFEHLSKTDEGPDSFREFIYASDAYKSSVEQLMPFYDGLGVLD